MRNFLFTFITAFLFIISGFAQTAQVNQNLSADSAGIKKPPWTTSKAFITAMPKGLPKLSTLSRLNELFTGMPQEARLRT